MLFSLSLKVIAISQFGSRIEPVTPGEHVSVQTRQLDSGELSREDDPTANEMDWPRLGKQNQLKRRIGVLFGDN